MILKANQKSILFDGQISMAIINPLFSDEMSATLQATAPDDDNGINRAAFGFLNRVDIVSNKTRELPASIEHSLFFTNGTMVVKYQNGSFPFYYKASGDFWGLIQNKELNNLTFTVIDISELSNSEIQSLVNDYNRTDIERPFCFPTFINKKIYNDFPVKFNHDGFCNKHTNSFVISATNPLVPCPYLKEIYKAIFERNGISIRTNAFETHPELSKLILASNYMLNEFSIDLTLQSTTVALVQKIASGKDPVVTTCIPHNIVNYAFIRITGVTYTLPSLVNKVFQAEVIDSKTFKLIGADTSNDQPFDNLFLVADSWIKDQEIERLILTFTETVPDFTSGIVYLRSSDFNGLCVASREDDNTVHIDFYDGSWIYYNFTSPSILFQQTVYPDTAGNIEYLPNTLVNHFKTIDLKNHVPDVKINDFLKQAYSLLGLCAFVNDQSRTVDLILIRDILLSSEAIDISDYAGEIEDIENPEETEYILQMTADGSDDYYKAQLPKTSIDDYTIKDPVATFANLPFEGSETNDARLVVDENAYYSFSRSFLNAINSWKFLTYNHLDKSSNANASDNQLLKHTTNFSTLIPEVVDEKTYASMKTSGESNSFLDVKTEIKPRILNYHGVIDRGYNNLPYASMGTTDEAGNTISGATLNLKWDGTNGLYEKYWKEYMYWRLNTYKQCQCLIQWPEHLIVNFKAWKKYRIRGVDYLVVKIPIVLAQENRKIYSSKTELVRV